MARVRIEKRPIRNGRRRLRLATYRGYTTTENGSPRTLHSYESLDLWVWNRPTDQLRRQHNADAMRIAETIRDRRQAEMTSNAQRVPSPRSRKVAPTWGGLLEAHIAANERRWSKSNTGLWKIARRHLETYLHHHLGAPDIEATLVDTPLVDGFACYLETTACSRSGDPLKPSTCASYYNRARAVLTRAHADGQLVKNPAARSRAVSAPKPQREYLTLAEVEAMARTPCERPVLKRAFLFACLVGLRWSDVQQLRWGQVQRAPGGDHLRLVLRQEKTGEPMYLDVPPQGPRLMGERAEDDKRVFPHLRYSSHTNLLLARWAMRAGITKRVTFHTSRHTFAVGMLSRGVPLYTVSKLLGHSSIATTEIYANIVEQARTEAMLEQPHDLGGAI